MPMMRTLMLLAAAVLASAAVVVTAGAAPSAAQGVTAKSILLEGTFPLSGPASGYAPIPGAMQAYFAYINARGGVNGRKIVFRFEDDVNNPANTLQLTHKFVEQDHAFALVGGLGTEPQLPVRQYLNDNKVPQLFVSSAQPPSIATGRNTRGRSAGSPTTRPRVRSTGGTSPRTSRRPSWACSTRTTTTATTTCAA